MKNWLHTFPKGVPLLLVNSLLMNLGFFALIPYLSYHLTQHLLWTPFLAGLLLMIRQMSQQGPSFFMGMLADRIGYKALIAFGLILRGVGFSLFAFFENPLGLFMAAIITGLGGSMFEPTSNASLTALTNIEERGRIYAIKKVMANVGIALAALLGAILITFDFMFISLACGGIFVFIGILTYVRMPNIQVQLQPIPFIQMWKSVIADKIFISFTFITIGFYFIYMQLFLTIPLKIIEITNEPQSISLIYLLLSAVIIIGQYPINRITSRFNLSYSIMSGLTCMGIGIVILGTSTSLGIFIIGFLILLLGIMMTEPSIFDFISRLCVPSLTASYFGFASLAMAIGGGISQGAGGLLLQLGDDIGFPTMLWWLAGFVAILSILGIYQLQRKIEKKEVSSSSVDVSSL